MSGIYSRIIGTGSYLPAKVLTNAVLAGTVDTSDEWIQQRTGIRERHIAADMPMRISCFVRDFLLCTRSIAVINMPGVQNPHCRA